MFCQGLLWISKILRFMENYKAKQPDRDQTHEKKILHPKDYRCTDELYWNSQRMSYCQGYTTPELVALWDSLRYHCDLDIAYTMGSIVYRQRKSEDPSSDTLEFKLPMPHARTMPHRWRAVRWVADSLYNPPTGLDGGHLCPHRPLTLRLRSGEQFDLLVPECECF